MKIIKYVESIGAAASGVLIGLACSVSMHLKQVKQIEEMGKRNTKNLEDAAQALQKMGIAAQKAGGSIKI